MSHSQHTLAVSLTIALSSISSLSCSQPHPQTSQDAAIEQLDMAADNLNELKNSLSENDPVLGPIIESQLEQVDDIKEILTKAETVLPVDQELSSAIAPMAFGRFEEAAFLIDNCLQEHPHHQMAGFASGLCHLELGNYAAAHLSLTRAFPEDKNFPAVRFLKLFATRLNRIGAPSADQIADAADWAHLRIHIEIEQATPEPAWTLIDPLSTDMALIRFLMLADSPTGPLALSHDRIIRAAEEIDSPWLPIAMEMLIAHHKPEETLTKNARHCAQLADILTTWYGKDNLYTEDSPERINVMRKLARLDPENGAWRLLQIPYAYENRNDDQHSQPTLTGDELSQFLAASQNARIQLDHPQTSKIIAEVLQNSSYPYPDLFARRTRPPYNTFRHASNIINRAIHTGMNAIDKGNNDQALEIANCIEKIADNTWSDGKWSLASRLRSYLLKRKALKLRAEAYRNYPAKHAAHLRQLAELETSERAFITSSYSGGFFETLPLSMLHEALLASDTPEDHFRRAQWRLRDEEEVNPNIVHSFSNDFIPRDTFYRLVIANLTDAVPVITQHIDNYSPDQKWKAIWALGKLADQRARMKLDSISNGTDPMLSEMAKWSLSQLP